MTRQLSDAETAARAPAGRGGVAGNKLQPAAVISADRDQAARRGAPHGNRCAGRRVCRAIGAHPAGPTHIAHRSRRKP